VKDSSKSQADPVKGVASPRPRIAEPHAATADQSAPGPDDRPASAGADIPKPARAGDERPAEWSRPEAMLRFLQRDRELIGYEIHDGLLQEISGAQMCLEALLQSERVPAGPAREEIRHALGLMRKAVAEGRRLIAGLRPPLLEEQGVVAAIEALISEGREDGPAIEFIVDAPSGRFEPLVEQAIFRIAQEAIANLRKHSRSDRAEVRLVQANGRIQIEVRDRGVGFDPGSVAGKRFGLQGIRERARLMHGRAAIESSPGKGTRVLVDLPLAATPTDAGNHE
jgi:signal transduction histidine kinase